MESTGDVFSGSSNQRRSSWRVKCRERLAIHIEETLGIHVKPDDVRLKPDNETRYAWEVDDPSLSPLFRKQLSKHSVGAYVTLYVEVGKSFRAVHCDAPIKKIVVNNFQERVSTLEAENTKLSDELETMKKRLEILRQEKSSLDEDLQRYRNSMASQKAETERKINSLEELTNSHKQNAENWMSVAACYEKTYNQCSTGLTQAIAFLQGINADIPVQSMDFIAQPIV